MDNLGSHKGPAVRQAIEAAGTSSCSRAKSALARMACLQAAEQRPAGASCSFEDVLDVTTLHAHPEAQSGKMMVVGDGVIGWPPIPTRELPGLRRSWASIFRPRLRPKAGYRLRPRRVRFR
jgi:hypothetical protein